MPTAGSAATSSTSTTWSRSTSGSSSGAGAPASTTAAPGARRASTSSRLPPSTPRMAHPPAVAEARGRIKRGDTLIEPTSGNTGIALAMAAATRGYKMVLIMPEHLSAERRQTMRAFGAEIVLAPQKGGMEAARDLAERMVREGKGTMLDQFANPANPLVHYETTGPEIWRDTDGRITHFVSSMGTTGTIMGCSRSRRSE